MAVRTLRKIMPKAKQSLVLALALNVTALLPSLSVSSSVSAMTTEQAHEVLRQHYPQLLGHGAELVSLYYFGSHSHSPEPDPKDQALYQTLEQTLTVIGLERVGDDYLPVRWLLVFKNDELLGWYHPVSEFPMAFKAGELVFPVGVNAPQVPLVPQPPLQLTMGDEVIPFVAHYKQAHPEQANQIEMVTP